MGSTSHLEPQRFANALREYLNAQIEALGADNSGRWLETHTHGARSRNYWRKITNGAQAMTSNDIEVIATTLFDQTPYEFIRATRAWNTPAGELIEGRFGVETGREDDKPDLDAAAAEHSEDRGEDQ